MSALFGLSSNPGDKYLSAIDMRMKEIAGSQERLATGSRIVRAADDAAGAAIHDRATARQRSVDRASQNIQEALNMFDMADGGLQEAANIIQRLRVLALQSINAALTDEDRVNVQKEANELLGTLNDIAEKTTYGGNLKLLNGTNKADVLVVFDRTGSMSSYRDAAREQLESLVERLQGADIDVRVGFLGYWDAPSPPYPDYPDQNNWPFDKINLTGDIDQILNKISTLTTFGGFDIPEAGLEALMEVQTMGLRQNSIRNVIWVSDAPVHDADGTETGSDQDSVFGLQAVAKALEAEGIRVNALNLNTARPSVQTLSAETGGQVGKLSATKSDMDGFFYGIGNDVISNAKRPIRIQMGPDAGDVLEVDLPADVRPGSLGIKRLDLTSVSSAQQALDDLDEAMLNLTSQMADVSSQANRLEHILSNNQDQDLALIKSSSNLGDADMAQVVGDLVKEQIVFKMGSAYAVQANQIYRQSFSEILMQIA